MNKRERNRFSRSTTFGGYGQVCCICKDEFLRGFKDNKNNQYYCEKCYGKVKVYK